MLSGFVKSILQNGFEYGKTYFIIESVGTIDFRMSLILNWKNTENMMTFTPKPAGGT